MIDFLKQQISREASAETRVNLLREHLQLLCLKIMHDKDYFRDIAFVGGTALRILYDIKRFSEDLDFSVIDKKRYDFQGILGGLLRELKLNGLEVEAKKKVSKTVQESMLRFPGLLKEMGLSALEKQKISVKIEVDSNPPPGWQIENTVINKAYILNITHYDLPSLYATKLHACFFRRYTKGRDFYDLLWYLGKRIRPNYDLLNNAVAQTQGKDLRLSEKNIGGFLVGKLEMMDFVPVRRDVERFLEDRNELRLIEKGVFLKGVADTFVT
jgi:predicted nucleotidyltransferase component of viral defense system